MGDVNQLVHDPEVHKLGKKVGVVNDYRTVKAAAYMAQDALLPKAPSHVDRTHGLTFNMLGNDAYGDCTFAATQHGDHTFDRAKAAEPPDQDVVNAYLTFTHGQDSGCYLLDVLNHWHSDGILGETIAAFAQVKINDRSLLHTALWLFGGLYTGIGLPNSAQRQEVWDVAGDGKTGDSEPYSWGGHCVWVSNSALHHGGDDGPLECITWGAKKRMTWQFVQTYMDEAYVIIHPDWLARHRGKTPQGFSLDQLLADVEAIRA